MGPGAVFNIPGRAGIAIDDQLQIARIWIAASATTRDRWHLITPHGIQTPSPQSSMQSYNLSTSHVLNQVNEVA